MKAILLLLLIIKFIPSYSQIEFGNYVYNISDEVHCDLCLFENGQYCITITELICSDIVDASIISYGGYYLEKDTVLLFDSLHDYKMKLLKINEGLKVDRAFCFLQERIMLYDGYYDILPPLPRTSKLPILENRRKNKETNKQLNTLSLGNYYSENGYEISLFAFGLYKLKYKGYLLSKGFWIKDRNELRLFDPVLSHGFYLFIHDKKLKSSFLPGDYNGVFLKTNE